MKQNPVREELVKRYLEALQQDRIPWIQCWGVNSAPINAISGKRYRGINRLMLSDVAEKRGYTDPRWCTFLQAKEKGWRIRKGEGASRVEYWMQYDKLQKKYIDWAEAERLCAADPHYDKNLVLRCWISTVFNGAQIDGIPAYEKKPELDIGDFRKQRDTLIQNMGVGYAEHGDRAFYSPAFDSITLPPEQSFHDTYGYMATLLHEAAHATGHPARLNRDLSGRFGSESYAREELRAEIASSFTSQELGIAMDAKALEAHFQAHAGYIQSWISVLRKDPNELFKAINDAQAISDYLIEKGRFLELETELKTDGPLGEHLRFKLEAQPEGGLLLRISGTGAIPTYEGDALPPWHTHLLEIKSMVIEPGITAVGRGIFDEMENLEYLEIPKDATIAHLAGIGTCPKLKEIKYTGTDHAPGIHPENATLEIRQHMLRSGIDFETGKPISTLTPLRLMMRLGEAFPGHTREQLLELSAELRNASMPGSGLKDTTEQLRQYEALVKAGIVRLPTEIEKGEFDMEHKSAPELFKAGTVQQRRIMEWLAAQGITGEDVASAQLSGPAMVRLTNPAGQYMDVYCSQDNTVRVLDVTEEREADLQQLFWDETNEPESQEWREDLTADEAAMVEQWDLQTAKGFSNLASEILERSTPTEQIMVAIESTDDYTDANFHAELIDMHNPDGSWGTVVNQYRLVKIGDSGRIEALDEDLVFPTKAQAKAIAECIPYARLVDYDTLVHEAGKNLPAKYTMEEIPATMTVVMVEPNKQARITQLPHTLDAMQEAVGGGIEAVYPFEDPVAIICNEEGKQEGMPLNRGLHGEDGDLYDILCGTFFVTGVGTEDFCSLSPDLAQKYLEQFKSPEQFFRINGHTVAMKTEQENVGQALEEFMAGQAVSQESEPAPAAEGPVLTMGG